MPDFIITYYDEESSAMKVGRLINVEYHAIKAWLIELDLKGKQVNSCVEVACPGILPLIMLDATQGYQRINGAEILNAKGGG